MHEVQDESRNEERERSYDEERHESYEGRLYALRHINVPHYGQGQVRLH